MRSAEVIVNPPETDPIFVVLGVPSFGLVSVLWHAHMTRLQLMNIRTHEINVVNCEVGEARNRIVRSALDYRLSDGTKASHVFFVDDDVLVPPHALLTLLAHDRPMVSGLYYAKTAAPQPLVMNGAYRGVDRDWSDGDLVECAAHGMGCTLIERRVFESIEEPWFRTVNTHDGDRSYHGTEDVYFCEKARAAGFQPTVDTGLFCPHWSHQEQRWYPLDRFNAAQRAAHDQKARDTVGCAVQDGEGAGTTHNESRSEEAITTG